MAARVPLGIAALLTITTLGAGVLAPAALTAQDSVGSAGTVTTSSAGTLAPAAPPPLSAEQWRADVRALLTGLKERHRNLYHTTPPAAFDSAAAALVQRLPRLARHQVVMEMARIAAMAGDGHTNIQPTRDAVVGFRVLPVALHQFKDGLWVRAARSPSSSLAGARVTRIGDATAEEALERTRPYIGRDNEQAVRYLGPQLLAMPEVLHAIGLSNNPDSARFEIEQGDEKRTVWLRAAGLVEPAPADVDVSLRRRAGWVDARDAGYAPEPLWLRSEPDSMLWWHTTVPGTRTVYAQINQVRNGPAASFEEFTERLFATLDSGATDRLVIDLRLNRGGHGDLLRPLVRGLVRRPVNERGRLMVLIGRSSGSAAQFLLDDLERYSEAVFIGEPSASRGNHFGDARGFTLPNSRITVRAPSLYWQHWDPRDTRPWTAPEVAAEMTFADYRANRDPALEAALTWKPRPSLVDDLRLLVGVNDTLGIRKRIALFREDPANAYQDLRPKIDSVATHFQSRRDLAAATRALELAANEFPESAPTQVSLAELYVASGRKDLARTRLTRALQLDPKNEAAASRLKELGTP